MKNIFRLKPKEKLAKWLFLGTIALLSVGILFFLLRGPYLSNSIKRLIIPVFEQATGEKIIIDSAAVNLFPLYLQAKGFKVFDKNGNRLLRITKVRAYTDLSGLFFREIRIRRLSVREPELTADKRDVERIISSVKRYLKEKKDEDISVSLKSAKLTDGKFILSNKDARAGITGKELFMEMSVKNTVTAMLLLKDARLNLPDLPEIKGSIEGTIRTDGRKFEVLEVKASSSGSTAGAKGVISPSAIEKGSRSQGSKESSEKIERGSLSGYVNILVSTIRKIFNLKTDKDGELFLSGSVDLLTPQQKVHNSQFIAPPTHPSPSRGEGKGGGESQTSALQPLKIRLNLKTKGWFYLETLMELLKIEDNISGIISFDGKISGVYPEILGEAEATLKNSMMGDLHISDAEGTVKYEDKEFSIENLIAHTYGGELKGKAHLSIPHSDYSVTAEVADINSPEFLRFIQWEPPFPRGKISGDFNLNKRHEEDFDIKAEISYTNTTTVHCLQMPESAYAGTVDCQLEDRLKSIKGTIDLKEGILTVNDSLFSTSQSNLFLKGNINFNNEMLNLDLNLESRNALDLTVPYYNGLTAPVNFRGTAKGSLEDPALSGSVKVGPGNINGVPFTSASGDLTYSIKSLSVSLLRIEEGQSTYDISGNIKFRKAKELFSFDSPYFDATAVIKNGDAGSLIKVVWSSGLGVSKEPQSQMPNPKSPIRITGSVDGQLSFKGDRNEFSGKGAVTLVNGTALGQIVDRAVINAVLSPQKIDFTSAEAVRNESSLLARGSIYFDGRFDGSISSDNIELKDTIFYQLPAISHQLLDARLSADIKGSGTFKNPEAKFSLKVLDSSFRGAKMGRGIINGELKNKGFSARGSLFEGIVTVDASGVLSKPALWEMVVNFKKGNYDFILAGFLKEAPKDLSVSLEGVAKLENRGGKLSMASDFSFINLSLYGYNLKNKENVVFKLSEDEFTIKPFSLSGRDADISASGVVRIGRSYNVALAGKINLEPLRTIGKAVELQRGEGIFNIGVSGRWKDPEFRGEINLRNSIVLVSGFPYKIGPVNGDIFLNKDRVNFESFNADFANGRVGMSGAAYLKELTLRGLNLTATFTGIRLRPVKGVTAALDGRLFYDSSAKGQSLTGDIYIKRAKYEKRIEWKSGLLALRGIKKTGIKQPVQIRVVPAFLGKTRLNVRIAGEDNISIDNNIARTPVKIDLTVSGTVAQYGLIGRVKAGGGSIFFRGNEFKIIDGTVDFVESSRITPVFHIQAETFTKGYRIRLSLDGPVDRFTLSLFSDPPLSDTDILTLLTVGQVSKEAKGFESGIGAGEATSLLTGELQEVIEERFKYITGFERFEIDPQTSSSGAVTPKVTVGKRLFKDKIFATYSTSIGTSEEHIVKLEYNLTKNVSLVGSRDEIGSIGADIKFRFEFK